RENDALDLPRLQHGDGHRHGDIALAGSGGPQRHDELAALERANVVGLVRRARHDLALARADHEVAAVAIAAWAIAAAPLARAVVGGGDVLLREADFRIDVGTLDLAAA